MISSQVIQNSIDDLKAITKVDLGVYDLNGSLIATTANDFDITAQVIGEFSASPADSQIVRGMHIMKVLDEGAVQNVLVARGGTEDAYTIARIAVTQLQALIVAYKEKYDRNSFLQNLLLDNLLLVDIYNRAKKLHIEVNDKRAIFLVEAHIEKDSIISDLLKGMFSSQNGDYVTAVDESNVILVKRLDNDYVAEDLDEIAQTITDMVNAEAMMNVRVAYGNVVSELKDLSKSYKEAKMALDVGKIFYAEKKVISYASLGIGRLIYQLPVNLCRLFMDEVFGGELPEELDEETLNTINKFFENNLNVSETSRQLFVHRNTLVYRLEKIAKSVGLDVRNFDDALTFKIALMVASYMKYLEELS